MGVVRGGTTKGGQVRYLGVRYGGHKCTSKPESLIVLSNEQAIGLAEKYIGENNQAIERFNTQINSIDVVNDALAEARIDHKLQAIERLQQQSENLAVFIGILRGGGTGRNIAFEPRNP